MGIRINFQPMFGLGFAFHFTVPVIEVVLGPFIILFGDLDGIDAD